MSRAEPIVALPIKRLKPVVKAGDDWKNDLQLTSHGRIKKSLANTIRIVSTHPAFAGVVAFDEFRGTVRKLKKPPVRDSEDPRIEFRPGEWSEQDTTRTIAWFSDHIGYEPTDKDIDSSIVTVAQKNSVHPVREHLRSLVWDGTPRVEFMLSNYFGAEHSDVVAAISSKWMISAVARVEEPGCKVDHLMVLEGEQGTGKSSACRLLGYEEWFADTGISIGDKDSYQALAGKWIYELAELSSVKGREVEKVKSFLSSSTDHYRPSYGRRMLDVPRQTVFVATTNESHYLTDGTGNRRFWPVQVGRVDLNAIIEDRDQLWAEAMTLYRSGTPWHIEDPAINNKLAEQQAQRLVGDDWQHKVSEWLNAPCRTHKLSTDGVTTQEILTGALEMRPAELDKRHTTRLGIILRELKWASRQLWQNGARVRRYYPT